MPRTATLTVHAQTCTGTDHDLCPACTAVLFSPHEIRVTLERQHNALDGHAHPWDNGLPFGDDAVRFYVEGSNDMSWSEVLDAGGWCANCADGLLDPA